jgi:hypothetical protein
MSRVTLSTAAEKCRTNPRIGMYSANAAGRCFV